MQKDKQPACVCTSVFKEGQSTTKTRFTKKWIELINRMEKEKGTAIAVQKK